MSINSKPEDEVRATVPFAACQKRFERPVELDDFYSTAMDSVSPASKSVIFSKLSVIFSLLYILHFSVIFSNPLYSLGRVVSRLFLNI